MIPLARSAIAFSSRDPLVSHKWKSYAFSNHVRMRYYNINYLYLND